VAADRVQPRAEPALAPEGALERGARRVADVLGRLEQRVRRPRRRRLAEDLGGDALHGLGEDAPVAGEQGLPRVGLDVDEAGRDDEPRRVDAGGRPRVGERAGGADPPDAVADDADVTPEPRIAGAVDDLAAGEDDVVGDALGVRRAAGPGLAAARRERQQQGYLRWGESHVMLVRLSS
jgi:hypothetical protein